MPFISYAQNLEDVVLHRALGHINDGFYVDVGAYDPVHCSVTKAFYDAGWRGINVEPTHDHFQRLSHDRPKDINLNCAVSDTEQELELFEIENTGLSTAVPSLLQQHQQQGWASHKRLVRAFPLRQILEPYKAQPIHFLKIDVEGMETNVVKGMDFDIIRPWILLLENTDFPVWEPILLAAGYEFTLFDGLNRFYVAKEHQELKPKLTYPACVFDNYIQHSTIVANEQLKQECEIKLAEVTAKNLTLENDYKVAIDARSNEIIKILKQHLTDLENRRTILEDHIMRQNAETVLLRQNIDHLNSKCNTISESARDEKTRQDETVKNLKDEIIRLRKLVYSSTYSTHLYRAWRVMIGDAHYKQKISF